MNRGTSQMVIEITEIIGDDYEEYCVSYSFDAGYDDEYYERLVDAEAFADEVNEANGGECEIVKPSI